ncbi:MAG: hypothetical protein IBJ18_04490 [Phycisphaerales bacterium]|nr:hypothetical protein [Phycisphaerales bacterium]
MLRVNVSKNPSAKGTNSAGASARAFILVALIFAGTTSRADEVVVPESLRNVPGNSSTNTLLRETGNPRTLQIILGRQQLAGIAPGSLLSSLAVRIKSDGTGAWPSAPLSFSNYSVNVATAINPASAFSNTFASNTAADSTVVFNAPLSISANQFPGGAPSTGVNDFATLLNFSAPVLYHGQDIAITLRHPGSNAPTGTTRFLDAINNTNANYGTGGIAAISAVGATTATGAAAPAPIIKLGFAPLWQATPAAAPVSRAGEPADGAAFGNLLTNTQRSYQVIIDRTQLGDLPIGSTIEGVRFRLAPSKSAWPAAGALASFAAFDIQMGQASRTALTMSSTYSENFISALAPIGVRSGALNIAPGSFPDSGASPSGARSFSEPIPFTTPYTYIGGGLAVLIRHSAGSLAASPQLDASPINTGGVRSMISTGENAQTATLGSLTATPIVSFDARPALLIAPDPAAALLTGNQGQNPGVFATTPATLQTLIAEDLTSIIPPGSLITGISLRAAGESWPSTGALTQSLEIILAKPNATTSTGLRSDPASNRAGSIVRVRTGPWGVSKDAFPITPQPAQRFGPTITFDRPYVYGKGDLHLTISTAGFPTVASPLRLDSLPLAVGGILSAQGAGFNSTQTTQIVSPVMRLHYTPAITRPASLASVRGSRTNRSLLTSQPSTTQFVVSMSELPLRAQGMPMTGLALRLAPGEAAWPTSDLRAASMQITVAPAAQAAAPASASTKLLRNISPTGAKVVRSGELVIPAWSLRATDDAADAEAPAPPSFVIAFQSPYIWRGGDLVFTIVSSGIPGAGEGPLLDAGNPSDSPDIAAFTVNSADPITEQTEGQPINIPVVTILHAKPIWRAGCDIADDRGNSPPTGTNSGINEGDYNAFFNSFFLALPPADIADDQGTILPTDIPNNGVNEGDYNAFFNSFFDEQLRR